MVKKKQITTEDLAIMVQSGFGEMKEDMDIKFKKVHEEFQGVNKRLDRIENILIAGHDRRIERLEDGMLQIKTALKIKTR